MLKRSIVPVLIILAVFATACAPQTAPTMSPEDSQNTAVAAAWTMVAATQLALPTNTLPPPTQAPTSTPMPTFTPFLLPTPTFSLQVAPTQQLQSAPLNPEDCTSGIMLNLAEAGPTTPVIIDNQSGGDVRIAFNMWERNIRGQCGGIPTVDVKNHSTQTINVPRGKWYAWAWISLKNGGQKGAPGNFSIPDNNGSAVRLVIKETTILVR